MPISATIISYAVIFWSVRKHRLRISIWHRLGAQSPKVPRQATDQREDSKMTKSHRSNSDLQIMSDPGATIINGSPPISPTRKTSQIRPWKVPWDIRSKGSLQAVGRINQTQIEITVQEIQVESNGPPDHSYREDPRNQEADQGNIDKFYSSRLSIKESKKLESEESDSESCTDETSAAGTQENNTPDIRLNLVENNSSKKAKDMKAQSEDSIKILADGEEKQKYQKNGELFHLVETKVLDTGIQKTSKPHSTRKEDFSHNKLTPVPVARAKKAQRSDSKKQIAREYQVAKTGCLLVIIFIICYGPYSIAHLCHKTYHVPLWAEHFSMWCVFLNGILSPVVYGIRNKAIRTEARNLVLCKR